MKTNTRILIVDDIAANVALLAFVLGRCGYDIDTAVDAPSARAAIASNKPRLILMDLQLPGIDGYELTRMIKADAATADVVIVAVTSYAMPGDEALSAAAGCDGYLSKPIDVNSLPSFVAGFL